jgi:hypothetical protein
MLILEGEAAIWRGLEGKEGYLAIQVREGGVGLGPIYRFWCRLSGHGVICTAGAFSHPLTRWHATCILHEAN